MFEHVPSQEVTDLHDLSCKEIVAEDKHDNIVRNEEDENRFVVCDVVVFAAIRRRKNVGKGVVGVLCKETVEEQLKDGFELLDLKVNI